MTNAELRDLVEAALTARRARKHCEAVQQHRTRETDMSRNDLAVAAAFARDDTQRRLDEMLDAYERRKRGIPESEAL